MKNVIPRPTPGAALLLICALAVACASPSPAPEPAPEPEPAVESEPGPRPEAAEAPAPGPETPEPAPDGPALASGSEAEPAPVPEPEPEPEPAPEPAPMGPSATGEADSIVLARVNGTPLSLQEALDAFLTSHSGHGVLIRGEPAVRELTSRLIEDRVFYEEGVALGILDDPDLHEAVEDFRLRKAESLFWEREVDEAVEVTDEEVEAFYESTRVAVTVDMIEVETREEAEALRQRVADGEDMGDLAEEHSIHESRDFGGKLPFLRRGMLENELEEAAFALAEPGELSAVLTTSNGFALLRLEERIENAEALPRQVALPRIRDVLEQKARETRRAERTAAFEERADIRVEEQLLTRAAIVGELPSGTVLARSAGEELTLGEAREMLNVEAVEAATEEEFAPAMAELVDQWTSREALGAELERVGMFDDKQVRGETRKYHKDAVLGLLHDRYVWADVTIDEAAVRAYYEEHLDTEFTSPAEVRLAYMVLGSDEDVQAAQERLAADEAFGVVARGLSIDPTTKAHGGRAGWIKPGEILPEVEAVAFALEPGARSEPIPTEVGTFILDVMEKKEAKALSFETAFVPARRGAAREARDAAHDEWASRLRERAVVEVDEEGIERAVAWLEVEATRREAERAALLEDVTNEEPQSDEFHGGGR